MPFIPEQFQAEVSLKLIPTEQLPSIAQSAIEAGFDGPHTLRMAILETNSFWEIDQALLAMMAELNLGLLSLREAALYLAKQRAREILDSGEDPTTSTSYFYRLMVQADYPEELYELGWFGDATEFESGENERSSAIEALENLLDPELAKRRWTQRKKEWEEAAEKVRNDWPYKWNSPGRKKLLRERLIERLNNSKPLIWIHIGCSLLLAWCADSWKLGLALLLGWPPIVIGLMYWTQYRHLKWERRDTLLRMRVPEEEI